MGLVKSIAEINENVFGASGLLKRDPKQVKLKEDLMPYSITTACHIPFPLQKKVKAELKCWHHSGDDRCHPLVCTSSSNCVDFKSLNMAVKHPHCSEDGSGNIAFYAGCSVGTLPNTHPQRLCATDNIHHTVWLVLL